MIFNGTWETNTSNEFVKACIFNSVTFTPDMIMVLDRYKKFHNCMFNECHFELEFKYLEFYSCMFPNTKFYGAIEKIHAHKCNFKDSIFYKSPDSYDLGHWNIPQGCDLHVWAAKSNVLVELLIPAKAKRTASVLSRKCRAEFAMVTKVHHPYKRTYSDYRSKFGEFVDYREGELVKPDSYNDSPFKDCTNGIHFFLTKEEALNWMGAL